MLSSPFRQQPLSALSLPMDVNVDAPTDMGLPPCLKRRRSDSFDSPRAPSSSYSFARASSSNSADTTNPEPPSTKRRVLDPEPRTLSLGGDSLYDLYIRPSYKPYWFDDGDVVLAVKDHLFKLPRRILACSEIFEDMFTFALPQTDADCFEGCAVVHLDDKPQDWMVLLQWIDDTERFWQRRDPLFEELAGMLRLSTKYEIPRLRHTAVKRVLRIWPEDVRMVNERAFTPHRVDGIALARHCDLSQILPAIFFSLAIDYESHQMIPTDLDPYDLERLTSGVSNMHLLVEQALQDLHVRADCKSCGQLLDKHWRGLAPGTWLTRLCMDMYGEPTLDIALHEGEVCVKCLAVHWTCLRQVMHDLESSIAQSFRL